MFVLLSCLHPFQAEADYYREVHLLDLKYQSKYDEINRKRTQVICVMFGPRVLRCKCHRWSVALMSPVVLRWSIQATRRKMER